MRVFSQAVKVWKTIVAVMFLCKKKFIILNNIEIFNAFERPLNIFFGCSVGKYFFNTINNPIWDEGRTIKICVIFAPPYYIYLVASRLQKILFEVPGVEKLPHLLLCPSVIFLIIFSFNVWFLFILQFIHRIFLELLQLKKSLNQLVSSSYRTIKVC